MLFMFMRGLGEIIIQNTSFKSFADVTNTYIGPFAVIIQHSQYVQPVTNPANGPIYVLVTSANDLKLVLCLCVD
jgi:hypothetical protein